MSALTRRKDIEKRCFAVPYVRSWRARRRNTARRTRSVITYTQLREDSESFSSVLRDMGEQGKHIAVIGMTSYAWLVTYFGTVDSGSVIVPLDVNLPAEDVCDLIARSDSTVLVYDEVRKDVAAIAKERCPQLKIMISMQQESHDDHAYSFWKLLEEHRGSFDYAPEPDQLCTIMFTSGTTGKSKGVMLTHRNVAENATCLDMKIPERIVIMTVLPIHHAYCLSMDVLKGVSLGAVICINDSLMRVAKNIKLFKPEMILMVPLMIETMAKKLEEASLLPAKIVKNFPSSGEDREEPGVWKTVPYDLQRRRLPGSVLYRSVSEI